MRPLPRRERGPESSISRKHIIRKNRRIARGLISIIGGKLTTYRNLAEQTVDRLGKVLGRKLPDCRTQETLLPGAYRIEEARDRLTAMDDLSVTDVERLLGLYGGRSIELAKLADGESCSLLEAEVLFAIREEMARTLADIVHRRLMIGFDADQGRAKYEKIASVAAAELAWDVDERDAQLSTLIAYSDSLGV